MQEPFFGATDGRRPQIAEDAFIAPAAVVTPGAEIPPASLAGGIPAKVVRPVRESDTAMVGNAFESYVRKSGVHRDVEPLSMREVLPR